jgi:hypothetical protein
MASVNLSLQTLLEDGRFEAELLDLQLACGNGSTFTGQGMLAWDATEGIRVEAITDGGGELIQSAFTDTAQPGELLRAKDYLQLNAHTQSGDAVCIERVMHVGSHANTNSPHVVWKWSRGDVLGPVTFEQPPLPSEYAIEPVVEMLLQPLSLRFLPERSTITDDNPHFGYRSFLFDWIQVTVGTTTFVARKHGDATVRVRVHPIAPEHRNIVGAIRLAFSFLAGGTVGLLATESKEGTRTTLRIHRAAAASTNVFAPPLGWGRELVGEFAPLLSKAVEFFMSKEGVKVASLLGTCWDTVDNSFTTQSAIAGAALEGIIGIVKGRTSPVSLISDVQEERLNDFLTAENYSDAFINRLKGSLGAMKHPNVKHIITDWHTRGVLDVSDEDARAWGSIRHPAAHGCSSNQGTTPDEFQENLHCLSRVHNLINKIVLQAMGYNGKFFDYAVWRVRDFPLADPSAL